MLSLGGRYLADECKQTAGPPGFRVTVHLLTPILSPVANVRADSINWLPQHPKKPTEKQAIRKMMPHKIYPEATILHKTAAIV